MSKYRHEIKYILCYQQAYIIKERLSCLMKKDNHVTGESYLIRSIYYDNDSNVCFFDNLMGSSERSKWRIRTYNNDDSMIRLENKQKKNCFTRKESTILSKKDYESITKGDIDGLNDSSAVLERFLCNIRLGNYKPTVVVQYNRIPFVLLEGNVRITLDYNICYSSRFDQLFDENMQTELVMPEEKMILEIKYDEYLPDYIRDCIQLPNMTRCSCSKYCLCRMKQEGAR